MIFDIIIMNNRHSSCVYEKRTQIEKKAIEQDDPAAPGSVMQREMTAFSSYSDSLAVYFLYSQRFFRAFATC